MSAPGPGGYVRPVSQPDHVESQPPRFPRALVLGGGGITGIAWMLGVLRGLQERGIDLGEADTVLGTSAGSVVGAQITSGLSLEELYETQLAPPDREIGANLSRLTLLRMLPPLLLPGGSRAKRARIGRMAMQAHAPEGGPQARRVQVIGSRIGVADWPERRLRVTTVDAESGELRVWERGGRADLLHAVAASCAVPLVWPPVTIGERHYVDGGVRSSANVDLAGPSERLVVLAPLPKSLSKRSSIPVQVARTGAAHHAVVSPDAEALEQIGRNVLDPAKRAAAARAGLRQAADVAEEVRRAWQA